MHRAGFPVPPPRREIKWNTTARLITDACRVPLGATVHYRSRSPFVVELALHTPSGEVVWRLDRDMLLAGTEAPTGLGEVHIRPAPYEQVVLRLGDPSHAALISLDRHHVLRWVTTSHSMVPVGTESSHIDWQPFLDVLAG
ncbi:SsgA family sporulation/cell division regulator [Streptomyces sp. NPDC001744]|uniref:SsgA family sporulation/cell division regulator n=1 Tax=Streptomyces sp. NPDC001744 TaxID=3364606 RepID=UPI003678A262